MNSSPALTSSYRFCQRLARSEAKNFYWSFLLLPRDRRQAMCALYAFMRRTDDLADEPADTDWKREELTRWRGDLDRALAGEMGEWPGWPALADTARRHGIPHRHLHEVINGVEMDLEPRAFANFAELRTYCDCVASAVGLCCIHIWGYHSDMGRAEDLAASCGLALQLTNIIRDIPEDARNGRIYLPQEDLARFGVAVEDLRGARMTDPLRHLLEFEAKRAYEEYDRCSALAELVDPVGRPVLRAIVGIYRALLDEIARRDYDVFLGRVSLSKWKKLAIAARSYAGSSRRRIKAHSDFPEIP